MNTATTVLVALAYQYVFVRGLWVVVCRDVVGTLCEMIAKEDRVAYVGLRFSSLKTALQGLHRLVHYDRLSRKSAPRLVVESTYAPGLAWAPGPALRLGGAVTNHERQVIERIVGPYQEAVPRAIKSAFVKVVSLKAHFAHDLVFFRLGELCRRRGGFFVATVTTDPFCRGHLVCIGLEEEMRARVLTIVGKAAVHVVMH
jgi:hypothetical protein